MLALILNRTSFGLHMRAVTQNRDMAAVMGIRTARVDALTFGLGSGIAGMAGVALSQIGNVSPNLGTIYIVDSFLVVVFGGVGNLLGTLVGALTLGIVNKILEPVAGADPRQDRRAGRRSSCSSSGGRAACSRSRAAPPRRRGEARCRRAASAAGDRAQRLGPCASGAGFGAVRAGARGPACRVLNARCRAGFAVARCPITWCRCSANICATRSWRSSLDLVWGYAGILSLGHGAFFALGGYAMGMYLMRQIGTRGVYQNPVLPDFMVFLQWKELPWFWWGFDHFAYAAAMVVLVPGVFAFVFGWLAFRSRVTGVYLSIITQAMTYALWLAFFRNDMGFGGNNGLTDFKDMLGFDLHQPATRLGLYLASAVGARRSPTWCAASSPPRSSAACCWRCATPKAGCAFSAIRSTNAKLFVFTVSAVLAGIAGALYVPQVGIINPSEFSPGNSIEIAIWVSVGGRGTLVGRDARRGAGQPGQDLADRRRPGNLAVRPRRAVRAVDAGLSRAASSGLRRLRRLRPRRGTLAVPRSRAGRGEGAGMIASRGRASDRRRAALPERRHRQL